MPQDAGFPDPPGNPPPGRRDSNPIAGRIDLPAVPAPDAAPPPPGLSAAPDLQSLLQALRRRWVAAVTLGGTLACIAALAAWFLLSPKYTAFARLRVASMEEVIQPGG